MSSSAVHSPVQVGTVIAGTYVIEQILGRGGMGTVWEAHHQRLPGKKVAIKILHASVADDADALARFRREAEIACRLGHPNIVEVHDFNKHDNGCPYLILELLHGRSLDERLKEGALDQKSAEHVLRQVASALQVAHDQEVIHRDLKPQNVFLVPSPTGVGPDIAKVLDFGISKIRGSTTVKTQESTLLGTPQYMAPEQATGKHDQVDARTDLFALASMAYELLSGRPAFTGQSIPEVVYKVVHEEPTPLATLVDGLPDHIAAEIHRALSKKQEDRHPSVQAFIESLYGEALVHTTGSHRVQSASELASAATMDSSKLDLAEAQTVDSAKMDLAQAHTLDSAKLQMAEAHTIDSAKLDKQAIELGGAETIDSSKLNTGEILAQVDAEKIAREELRAEEAERSAPAMESGKGAPKGRSKATVAWLAAPAVIAASLALYASTGGEHADRVADAPAADVPVAEAVRRDDVKPAPALPDDGEDPVDIDSLSAEESKDIDAGAAPAVEPDASAPKQANPPKKPAKPRKNEVVEVEAPPPATQPPEENMPGEAQQALKDARAALQSGDYEQALFQAKRANRIRRSVQSYLIQAKVHCARQDIAGLQAALRNLPKRAKKNLRRYCERQGFEMPTR